MSAVDLDSSVSVCIAAYNGADFVREQLHSIIAQLGPRDEVIVVDDCSTDETCDVVAEMLDSRGRIFVNSINLGHVRTFERAISTATGDLLLLADQDDVWPDGRVARFRELLIDHELVASGFREFGEGEIVHWPREMTGRWPHLRNILDLFLGRSGYFGCCMGLRRALLDDLLPFPAFVEAHDHWLGIVGNVRGSVSHVSEALLERRVHASNATPRRRRGIVEVLLTRLRMLGYLMVACSRRLTRQLLASRSRIHA